MFLKRLNLQGEMWLCSILLRRSVVYFLRANIKGEVWLIVPEWEFQGGIWCVCQISKYYTTVGNFKYAITIFKGTKGVAMATKFRKMSAKIAQISVSCKKSRNYSHVQYRVLWALIQMCYMNFQGS